MKNPKDIREKYEQSHLSDIGDQYTSFNIGKGWSMGEVSLKSLHQKDEQNLINSRNELLPKLQFQTHYPLTITKMMENDHVDGGVQILVQGGSKSGSKVSLQSKDGETKSSRMEVIQTGKTKDGEES